MHLLSLSISSICSFLVTFKFLSFLFYFDSVCVVSGLAVIVVIIHTSFSLSKPLLCIRCIPTSCFARSFCVWLVSYRPSFYCITDPGFSLSSWFRWINLPIYWCLLCFHATDLFHLSGFAFGVIIIVCLIHTVCLFPQVLGFVNPT